MFASYSYHRGAFIALVYLVFGFGWILVTDYLLQAAETTDLEGMQTYKGLFFVLLSSLLIFLLTYGLHQKMHRDHVHSRTVFNHSRLALIVCDDNGKVTNCNANISKLLGFLPQELKQKKIQDLVPEGSELPSILLKGTASNTDQDDFEFSANFIHKDGFLIPASVKGSVERDQKGRVQFSSFVVEDLSELKIQEEALRLQENFIETALVSLPIGVSIHRTDTNERTFINPKFEEIYGWSAEELTDVESFFNYVYPDPDYRNEIKTRISEDILSGDPKRMQWLNIKITTKSGEERYVNAINIPIPEQKLMVSTVQDVTESFISNEQLIEGRNQLLKLNKELLRSNKELEEFAYVASHDLQEPLRMVSQFTKMLERKFADRMDEDAKRYINFAVEGAQRMQVMINDLLEYSRVSSAKEEMRLVDLNQLLDRIESTLQNRASGKHVTIEREPLPVVKGIESLLDRLFMNLLDNGLKYNHSETPVVKISVSESENSFKISIADNGIGIDNAFSERIFVIFQRLHKRDEFHGTGIGLAVCKRIVERHGGAIHLEESKNGMGGATFTFSLPKHQD